MCYPRREGKVRVLRFRAAPVDEISGTASSFEKEQVSMRKFLVALAASFIAIPGLMAVTAGNAAADPCTGVWTIGIGGFTVTGPGVTGETSWYMTANQREGYNSADLNAGVNELGRLVNVHRGYCPFDHILIVGHSAGAAVAHTWVSREQDYPNLNVVLLSDPKRAAGPGGPGFSAVPPLSWLGYPYSGADSNFGSIPVLSICHPGDHICNSDADWVGYLTGLHNSYDFDAFDYSTTDTGVVFQ